MSLPPLAKIAEQHLLNNIPPEDGSKKSRTFTSSGIIAVTFGIAIAVVLSAFPYTAQYTPDDDSMPGPSRSSQCSGKARSGNRVVASWWMDGYGGYRVRGNTSGTVDKHSWVSEIYAPRATRGRHVWYDFLGRRRVGGKLTQKLSFTVKTAWGLRSRINKKCVTTTP